MGPTTKVMNEKFLGLTLLFFCCKALGKLENDKIARTNFLLAVRYIPIIMVMTWPVMMIESLTNGPQSYVESVRELIRNNYLHEDARDPGYRIYAMLRNTRERNMIFGGILSFANAWTLFVSLIFGAATIPRIIGGIQKMVHPPTNTTLANGY